VYKRQDEAPAAVGPYSQAVAAGPLVFCSGQIGLDPKTMVLSGDTLEDQTRQAMENLAAVLDCAGSSLEMVVKTTVYLKNILDFGKFNEIYDTFFEDEPPARAAVQVADLPISALVMIDAVALRD
jgi:2-iminobutanoate/2-iminopropanoate deaminase